MIQWICCWNRRLVQLVPRRHYWRVHPTTRRCTETTGVKVRGCLSPKTRNMNLHAIVSLCIYFWLMISFILALFFFTYRSCNYSFFLISRVLHDLYKVISTGLLNIGHFCVKCLRILLIFLFIFRQWSRWRTSIHSDCSGNAVAMETRRRRRRDFPR